jgi:hypothetical protein
MQEARLGRSSLSSYGSVTCSHVLLSDRWRACLLVYVVEVGCTDSALAPSSQAHRM